MVLNKLEFVLECDYEDQYDANNKRTFFYKLVNMKWKPVDHVLNSVTKLKPVIFIKHLPNNPIGFSTATLMSHIDDISKFNFEIIHKHLGILGKTSIPWTKTVTNQGTKYAFNRRYELNYSDGIFNNVIDFEKGNLFIHWGTPWKETPGSEYHSIYYTLVFKWTIEFSGPFSFAKLNKKFDLYNYRNLQEGLKGIKRTENER